LQVFVLEVAADGGTRVSDKEFLMCTELLMRQLLKLDGIQAEGEAKLQRKAEVEYLWYCKNLTLYQLLSLFPYSQIKYIGKSFSICWFAP